ncbi:MAG: hypothetical protein DRZ76_02655 [Candidatus Nealsonbacteria bacterium]|nr:MAG: hypothetical protein DRZ76_02655 [Candidatus Nealsonbacteria bacterium]
MDYDLNRPWETLDEWQKEYIYQDPNQNCFLLTGRQCGKTTAMAIKSVELCVHSFKEGENILICSITEKQAYRMLAKALAYAKVKYPEILIQRGPEKPTMHRIMFRTGAGIFCYAAGETGEGLRGDTIKKLMIDEGARMSEEFFISTIPMISVIKGSIDIASTPAGKKNPDGSEKFFYKCSKDDNYKKWYISAEDCPRHDSLFLEEQRKKLTKLIYAQEYLAIFTDEIKRVFDDELIEKTCILKRDQIKRGNFYLGVDIAGMGKDENSFEVIQKMSNGTLMQKENITTTKKFTTQTADKIIELDKRYNEIKKIGIDDGGIGFGVYSILMNNEETKRKTFALNNASRVINELGSTKKLLKEEMYILLLSLMENKKIKLLDDDEIKESLSSIQWDEGKIYGSYSHITEGIIRACWLAEKDKNLNIWIHTF